MAQNNQAFYTVTGPVHVFVRVPSTGAGPRQPVGKLGGRKAVFLGHVERTPEVAIEPQYKPVFCSLSGEAVPDDKLFLGEATKVVLDLARFDHNVVGDLLTAPRYGHGPNWEGSETYLDRGRLVQAHGDGYELWLQYSFFGTANAAGASPAMPPGYYFPCCITAGCYPTSLGRDTKKIRLMIEPQSVRANITGGYITYSKQPEAFAGLPDPG